MENQAIVKKIFVAKAGTINKPDSDILFKPYHSFCLHRLLTPPLSIELHHCQKDVIDTISVDVLKITVIRSFDASINCIFPTWYKITYSKYFFPRRYLGKLKRYVSNRARPEGSITKAYILKECINNWSFYIDRIETVHNLRERNEDFGESRK